MGRTEKAHESDKDRLHGLSVTGRLQTIPKDPAKEFAKTTLAAGAVVWRRGESGDIEVLLIHRPRYDDWSLAKGKVDPGESLPVTAAREIREETGFDVRLGKLLGRVTYPVQGRTKVVYYWTAEYLGGEFVANEEVDQIVWLPVEEAQQRVSYHVDGDIIAKAQKRFRLNPDTRLILVRHASAHPREGWGGNDDLRPLDRKGQKQASLLPDMLAGWKPDRVYSANPVRCQTTAKQMADHWNLDFETDRLLGDDAWIGEQAAAKRAFLEILEKRGVSVVVSQGITIPAVVAWFSAEGTLPIEHIKCKKAGVWILTFAEGQLCGADYLASPLPVR